jgi:2-polyprenyl-3-methyl-5-hydroxy-6-metoxy-1,4-benzoquinol methylase
MKCPICDNGDVNFLISKYDDRFGHPVLFEYYYCNKCNFAYLREKVGKNDMSKLYETYYQKTTVENRAGMGALQRLRMQNSLLRKIAGNVDVLSRVEHGSSVLEIGSGFRSDTKKIIKKRNLFWFGLEVNINCINEIKKDGRNVYYGTIEDIERIDRKFDVILLSQSMEHQYDINIFFINCKKLLNEHGKIIFTTPNLDSRYRRRYADGWIGWHVPYHVILLSEKAIDVLCEKYSFKKNIYYTYTPTSWYFLQKRFSIPSRGSKNETFNFNFPLLNQLVVSIFLRIREFILGKDNDCIYCELEILK